MSDTLPCIVCGKELESVGSGSPNHANNANEFHTRGQYGSTVFDPLDGSYLAVNICDACIVKAGDMGRVLTGAELKTRSLTPWRSDELASSDATGLHDDR